MWVYPPNCRTKVGARWSPSFPRQSLARRRVRNIVQVHAHALNGSWECYHVVRIGLGAIWGDHGRRRSLHFTTPHFCLKKGWVYPLLSISLNYFCIFWIIINHFFSGRWKIWSHINGSMGLPECMYVPVCMYLCTYVYGVFIKLHIITAQSGPVILAILCHSH